MQQQTLTGFEKYGKTTGAIPGADGPGGAVDQTVRRDRAVPYLLHGRETRVWRDQGYQRQTDVIPRRAPAAQDCTNRRYRQGGWIDETIKAKNREKSRVRAKVEHSIGVVKRVFGLQKVRYRGLAKNRHRLEVTAALANLFTVRRQPPRLQGSVGGGCEMTLARSNKAAETPLRTIVAPSFAVADELDALNTGSSDLR